MSPDTARFLLKLKFDMSQQRRVAILSKKAQAGALAPDEQADLDDFIRVGDLLAILQSRARQALQRAEPGASS